MGAYREIEDELADAWEVWDEIRRQRKPEPTLTTGSADAGRGTEIPERDRVPTWQTPDPNYFASFSKEAR